MKLCLSKEVAKLEILFMSVCSVEDLYSETKSMQDGTDPVKRRNKVWMKC